MAEQTPWKSEGEESSLPDQPPDSYVAWHIRTVDPGERVRDYKADVHVYMITEPSPVVCSTFQNVTIALQASCPSLFPGELDVFVAANRFETCGVLGTRRRMHFSDWFSTVARILHLVRLASPPSLVRPLVPPQTFQLDPLIVRERLCTMC